MPGTSLIGDYLTALSAQLPAPIVEELADGLEQTRLHYLEQGLDPDAAAGAALAEFGEPDVIVAAFTRLSPARRAARRLLATGPVTAAAFGSQYRSVGRAGTAGCAGITAVDAAMLATVTLAGPVLIWPLILAMAASAARLTFAARTLRPVLTS
jgi:hypothetical protein